MITLSGLKNFGYYIIFQKPKLGSHELRDEKVQNPQCFSQLRMIMIFYIVITSIGKEINTFSIALRWQPTCCPWNCEDPVTVVILPKSICFCGCSQ